MGSPRIRVGVVAVIAALLLASPGTAAADWRQTGESVTSVAYWQGITFEPRARAFAFTGPVAGVWRTDAELTPLAGSLSGIPFGVSSSEGWNHVGDLSFDETDGGRLLLPLECYRPTEPEPNTCGTGGVGVVDPVTLAWRYYVKLDPAEISKAMWVEASPDGRWVWTSSGTDLLAYAAADVSLANAGPDAAPVRARKRVPGALPASGVTGAAFWKDRLYVALNLGTSNEVVSYPVDRVSGDVGTPWRLEIERQKSSSVYESEGLAFAHALGGVLHWQIQPGAPFFSRILHFRRSGRD